MTAEILIVLTILSMVVLALLFVRATPDVVLMGGLGAVLVSGVASPKKVLAGFGNEGLITVALLFVIAEGLRQTGGLRFLSRLLGSPTGLKSAQTRLLIPTAAFSAFLNNTPVVAILLPIVNDWAGSMKRSVSQLMMPLSYAAILGGMCTLIGTSTTLVLNGLLIDSGHRGLGMFELAWVGIPATIIGLVYVIFCSEWLLPQRKPALEMLDDPREYTVEMLVQAGSPLCNKTIEEAGLRNLPGVYLMEIERDGELMTAVGPEVVLHGDDRLVFVGVVESIVDLQKISGLTHATDQVFKLDSPRSQRMLIEAVVSNTFPSLNMTIRESQFRTRYNAVVVAVARNGERLRKKLGDVRLQPGDTLLLEAPRSFIAVQRNSRDFFLVSEVEDSEPPLLERAWIARIILSLMVVTVAMEWMTMLKAAFVAAGLMVLTRCCRASQAKRAIDLNVLLTIAGGLGLGAALDDSGAARWLAGNLISSVGESPMAVLTVLFVVTSVLTNLITAKAAAVLIFPIAIASAKNLGDMNMMPFAITVMMAAAASFATPIGYQTNLMVYGPGGYRFNDFIRFGIPLTILIGLVTLGLAPICWPF